jgi:predicted RNA binding protein YcfA (HicA-like mRNA interferase family)
MKVDEAIRMIEEDGWFHIATRGSHRQYKHLIKPGRVTILKQAGLKDTK